MENPSYSKLSPSDRASIDAYGFTVDYFNEIPSLVLENSPETFNLFMQYYKNGEAKTYSEVYADRPEIIGASDPQIVARLDELMRQIVEAAKLDDEEQVKMLINEMRELKTN